MLDRWQGRAVLMLAQGGLWDGERLWTGFDDWCRAHAGQACRLWLSSAWLHELLCSEDLPLRDDAAAVEWARGVLLHYHGDAALAWPLAAWQQGRRRGVSALHGLSLDVLRSTAQASKVRLRAVMPWWCCVLQRALRRRSSLRRGPARLLVVEGCRLAVLDLQAGRIVQLQLRQIDGVDAAGLQRWCEGQGPTLATGYGLTGAPPASIIALAGLDGAAPQAGWT